MWSEGLFHAYDADHDYKLDEAEFTALHSIFCPCSKTVAELWAEYDTDEDGFFSLEEYTYFICSEIECRYTTSPAIFEERDVDEDDLISKAEFAYISLLYCPDVEKTIEELYQEYDTDYDG